MLKLAYILPLALGLAGASCLPETPTETEHDAVEAPMSSPWGLVHVRATHPRTAAAGALAVSVDAHFVQRAGLSREAVMAALGLWEPGAVEAGCVVLPAPDPADATARISLLDAGELGVYGNGELLRLRPRGLPSYVPQISGVVYGTESPAPPTWARGETYEVWGDGGDGFAPFSVSLEAPAPIEIVSVNGRAPGSAVRLDVDGDALTIDLSGDAAESWLTLRPAEELQAPALECRLDGTTSIRFDAIELDELFGDADSLDLTVRSVRVSPMAPASGGEGRVVFEFVDRLQLQR